ncbi:hypothetical protein CDAR_124541 [Caerostris darwini]|uniref:Uncharacterized protein n=1 Tax=Caerostris darwini TaxID=1538125 RepID=A0AAV4RH63_9ARAC|nr:hypothetical protein CDAR_124541 [Caerostris darwini]
MKIAAQLLVHWKTVQRSSADKNCKTGIGTQLSGGAGNWKVCCLKSRFGTGLRDDPLPLLLSSVPLTLWATTEALSRLSHCVLSTGGPLHKACMPDPDPVTGVGVADT